VKKLDCAHAKRLLSAHLDGELPREDRRLLEAHLEGCSDCRAGLESMRTLKEEFAGLEAPHSRPADRLQVLEAAESFFDDAPLTVCRRASWLSWQGAVTEASLAARLTIWVWLRPPATGELPPGWQAVTRTCLLSEARWIELGESPALALQDDPFRPF